jgi:tetratricopeptide (TPR) repeat protein
VKTGGEGAFAFPGYLMNRSTIELASGSLEPAAADANRALALVQSKAQPNSFSSTLGYAHLAVARVLEAQGKHEQARSEAALAAQNLQKCLGADHPETRAAVQLAALDSKP